MKKLMTIFLITTFLSLGAMKVNAGIITPYDKQEEPENFVNGATFVLKNTADYEEWLPAELQRAHDIYNINTITVYGLEGFDDAYKTCLFENLKKLGMKICVRIESYDGTKFAFTKEDADEVMRRHKELVEFTCLPENRDVVKYYALNMPVDDGQVQENLGGVNSEACKKNQVTYAEEIVRRMRELTEQNGFADAEMFLSVFFGWDASYEIPSYASAKADGYFINNYSYPVEGPMPDSNSPEGDIINANRLIETMNKFLEVYPEKPPLVVETGFHTLEYNNGAMPNQTAGLVYDRATKEIAVKAVYRFYKENYPNVIGLLYFGYNLFNQEGNPPAEMDWALAYPTGEDNEAETAEASGNAALYEDESASGGQAMLLEKDSAITYRQCPPTQQIALTYRAEEEVVLKFESGEEQKKEVTLPASAEYITCGIPLTLVEDYDLRIVCAQGKVFLDKAGFFTKMEAEYAFNEQGVQAKGMDNASNGMVAENLVGRSGALRFTGVRGGEILLVTYAAPKDTTVILERGAESYSVTLPAASELTEIALGFPAARGEDILLYEEADGGLVLDTAAFSGPPAVKPAEDAKNDEEENLDAGKENEEEPVEETEISIPEILGGAAVGLVIAGIFMGAAVAFTHKRKATDTKGVHKDDV